MLVGENLKFLKSSREVKWTHLNRSDSLKINIIQLFPGLRNLIILGPFRIPRFYLGILFPQLPELKEFFAYSTFSHIQTVSQTIIQSSNTGEAQFHLMINLLQMTNPHQVSIERLDTLFPPSCYPYPPTFYNKQKGGILSFPSYLRTHSHQHSGKMLRHPRG